MSMKTSMVLQCVCYLSQTVGPLQYACVQFPEKQGLLQAELLLVHSVEYQAQWT